MKKLYELSAAQIETLAYDIGDAAPNAYNNIAGLCTGKKRISDDVIQKALNCVLRQEQALRLKVVIKDGMYYQYAEEYSPRVFPVWNFENSSYEKVMEECKKFTLKKFLIPDSDLFFAAIIHWSGNTSIYLKIHNVIVDGLSGFLVLREIMSFIDLVNKGADIVIEEHRFTDCLERKVITETQREHDTEYWEEKYNPANFKPASYNFIHESTEGMEGGRISETLNAEDSAAVMSFSKKNDISISTVFLLALVLYIHSQDKNLKRIDIGQFLHNRFTKADRKTVGSYAGEGILCIDIDDVFTLHDLINSVRLAEIESLHHISFLYDGILKIASSQNPQITCLRNVIFNFIPGYLEQPSCSKHENISDSYDQDYSFEWVENDSLDTDISFEIENFYAIDNFVAHLDYKKNTFSETEAKKVLKHIMFCLRFCIYKDLDKNLILEDVCNAI